MIGRQIFNVFYLFFILLSYWFYQNHWFEIGLMAGVIYVLGRLLMNREFTFDCADRLLDFFVIIILGLAIDYDDQMTLSLGIAMASLLLTVFYLRVLGLFGRPLRRLLRVQNFNRPSSIQVSFLPMRIGLFYVLALGTVLDALQIFYTTQLFFSTLSLCLALVLALSFFEMLLNISKIVRH